MIEQIPADVIEAYAYLGRWSSLDVIDMGLINKTYLLKIDEQKYILQEVSPIFDVTIHDDSQAVSAHLALHGIKAPIIVPTRANNLYCKTKTRVFRILSHIAGKSFHKIQSLKMAKEAGQVLGRFHRALADFNYEYRSKRRHGGDYLYHLGALTAALKEHPDHEYFARVSPLASQMDQRMRALIADLSTTPRHAHGDPKISNILFNEDDEGLCLVDFDTLGRSGWSLEMGDALRSWCNPNKEDELDAHADLSIAEAALLGYGQHMQGRFSQKESEELLTHTQAITLCLAIRYLMDVLNEKYWAFDSQRFSHRAPHNWLRAQAMYQLFNDFVAQKHVLSDLIQSNLC